MTFQLDGVTVTAVIAIIVAVAGWVTTWRKAAMATGRQAERIKTLEEEQDDLKKKLEYVRGCTESASAELRAFRVDMEWVKRTLVEIKGLLGDRRHGE